MNYPARSPKGRAFSLMELAIVLLISSLVVGTVITLSTSKSSTDECFLTTRDQLNAIQNAIQQYATKNDRYPMPAKRAVGVDAPDFGREAAAVDLTVSGGVTYGALPFAALGLPTEHAADCWDNKFTYAVTSAYTSASATGGYLDPAVNGAITIRSSTANNLMTDAAYAVISHGPDGLGAVKRNAAAAAWCTDSTDLRTENCDADDAILAIAEFNDGKNAAASYFDDIAVFRGRQALTSAPPASGLYCWGDNAVGMIGDGSSTQRNSPVPVTLPAGVTAFTSVYTDQSSTCAISDVGNPYCWGSGYADPKIPKPVTLPAGVTATTIAMGNGANYAIGSDGILYQWPTAGAAAAFAMPNSPVLVRMGYGFQCSLAANSQIYCWGSGTFLGAGTGRLGNGSDSDSAVPVQVTLPAGPPAAIGFTKLSLGTHHVCAKADNLRTYCWGSGDQGRLGNGSYASSNLPATPVTHPAGVTQFVALSAGVAHSCAIGDNGLAYCWGSNGGGALGKVGVGADSADPVDVTMPVASFDAIVVGDGYTCAVGNNKKAYCWGRNDVGQLGDGTTANRNIPVAVALPAAENVLSLSLFQDIAPPNQSRTCAYLESGRVFCWGYGAEGQLGNGSGLSSPTPVEVTLPDTAEFIANHDGRLALTHGCVKLGPPPVPCPLPWGGTIPDGSSVFAYSAPSAPDCVAVRETRVCTAGVLSGSFTNPSCVVTCSAPSCDGSLVAPGCFDICYPDGSYIPSVGYSMFSGYTCNAGVWTPMGGMGGPYNYYCP